MWAGADALAEDAVPHQDALTIVAKVDAQHIGPLTKLLETMRDDPGNNPVIPFAEIPGCHFGRVLLLPASKDLEGQPIPPQLLLLTDCDGSARDHLETLVDTAGEGVDRLFGHCIDYPTRPTPRAARVAFLRGKSVPVQANYVHRQGRTVEQIRGEAELRDGLQAFLDAQSCAGMPALEVRKQICAFLKRHPKLHWALEAPPSVDVAYRARNALHFATLPLGLVAFGPVLIPAALIVYALACMQELSDPVDARRPSPELVRELTQLEDFFAHNGFTAGGYVKPGWVRQAVISAVLPLIGWGTRHLFTHDSLAGVKTIHFARWIPLDGGKRVVFASNYDGSLESYNNDFIDLVAWGLNLVFSNGYGYPKTRGLVFGGATREQEFKDFLRSHQIPTPIWYSAYPELTAVNVERNAKLRAGLRGNMSERQAQEWLRLL
jgi:hypothetical protein